MGAWDDVASVAEKEATCISVERSGITTLMSGETGSGGGVQLTLGAANPLHGRVPGRTAPNLIYKLRHCAANALGPQILWEAGDRLECLGALGEVGENQQILMGRRKGAVGAWLDPKDRARALQTREGPLLRPMLQGLPSGLRRRRPVTGAAFSQPLLTGPSLGAVSSA